MKICHVMTNFVRGGATNYMVDIMAGIPARHHLVCGPGSDFGFISDMRKRGIPVKVEKFLSGKNPAFLFLSLFTLFFFFRKEKFDIIHTNSTPAGFVGRVSGKLSGSKVVHTSHAVPFENRKLGFLLVFSEWLASFFCDDIIDVSDKIKKMLEQKQIGRGKHRVIPVGINVKKFRIASKAKLRLPLRGFRIITISRLVKGKGLEKFVEIANSYPDFYFIIAGDGQLRKYLESIASENVFFLGYRKDIHKVLKACDVLMLLSEHEGVPLAIYEAMAAGIPVISTNIGGISDYVHNGTTGFLVKGAESARKKLMQLSKNKYLRKKMANAAYSNIKNNTVERMMSDTKKVYEKCIGRPLNLK